MPVDIYIDGLCEPRNPGGVATYGFAVFKENNTVYEEAKAVGEGNGMSNNVAEYSGLCAALDWLLKHNIKEEITIRSDSQLVVNQMNRTWKCRGGMYIDWYMKALKLSRNFTNLHFKWIPREENTVADGLSRKAYKEYCESNSIKPVYSHPPKIIEEPVKKNENDETCMNCKWVKFSGPHIGCYRDNTYQRWIPKSDAVSGKCQNYIRG